MMACIVAKNVRHGELLRMTEEQKTELERDVRLYYDELLGEFVNVGFRLCEGDEAPELLRCLLFRRDYNVLVLPYDPRHLLALAGAARP